MSWPEFFLGLISQAVIVVVAWLGLRGKLAELGKNLVLVKKDASEAKAAAVKTESSINNRDSPASDRWDAIHDEVKDTQAKVDTALGVLARHTVELFGSREDNSRLQNEVTVLSGQSRGIRDDILELRKVDGQNQEVVSEAIRDRERAFNRLRAEVPNIIQRELNKLDKPD